MGEAYNVAQGLHVDGSPIIDPTTGQTTMFVFTGNPVTGTGHLDDRPGDRYLYLSSGPFTIAPGDSQEVIAAKIVGPGLNPKNSIEALKTSAGFARILYDKHFELEREPEPPTTPTIPSQFAIGTPYPNPFKWDTSCRVDIPMDTELLVNVYSIKGEHVKTLWDGPAHAGIFYFCWNGANTHGQRMASGVYLIRLEAPGIKGIRKVLLIR